MKLEHKEDALFSEWMERIGRDGFACDGAVCESCYNRLEYKTVFLLKETNDYGGGDDDLRKLMRGGERPQTFNNLARWSYGIRQLREPMKWENELQSVTQELRREWLKPACVMNLKKLTGGASAKSQQIREAAARDAEFIQRQLDLYKPLIVVCCGWIVFEAACELFYQGAPQETKKTTYGNSYFNYNKATYMYQPHPQSRYLANMLFYYLINNLRDVVA